MTVRMRNHDWLRLTVEEPLDPDLPICEPHHHLWDLETGRVAPRYLLEAWVSLSIQWRSSKVRREFRASAKLRQRRVCLLAPDVHVHVRYIAVAVPRCSCACSRLSVSV